MFQSSRTHINHEIDCSLVYMASYPEQLKLHQHHSEFQSSQEGISSFLFLGSHGDEQKHIFKKLFIFAVMQYKQ